MATRTPPRYVPTLTDVVASPAQTAAVPPVLSEDQLVHRIMQRVDLTLERYLREAIATTVLEHTRSLGPMLREEIEAVVQHAVSQALAEELAANTKSAR